MNSPTDYTGSAALAATSTKVIPFVRPTHKVSRSANAGQPRRAVGDDLANASAATPVPSRVALALGGLLRRTRETGRHGAVAIIQFSESRVLQETFGAVVGQRLGHAVRDRLSAALRRGDQVLPLERDAFVVLLADLADDTAAMTETRRLCRETGGTVRLDGLRFNLTTQAGVVVTPEDSAEPDELLRYARIALRHAGAGSTADVRRYRPQLLQQLRQQVAIAAQLLRAIEESRLSLHYQPQYALNTGQLVSAEALMRLRDRQGELIAPDHFIGIAEETGLIVELGRWAIHEACRQLADWRAHGAVLRHIAVNLSPRQLLDAELIPTIKRAVQDAGLAYSDLELELTESQMVENLTLVTDVLEEIAALGVRIAVDDFGTGYSSLAYLARLPLHRLKLDRSLVQAATGGPRAAQIVAAVVAMARELNLAITAEGIETEAQQTMVAHAGCDLGQGFLMARPMPADKLHSCTATSNLETA